MTNKERLISGASWVLIAFLVGTFLTIGTKTVNKFWPEQQKEIIVKHVYELGKGFK